MTNISSTKIGDFLFFQTPELNQRLELTKYLLEYSKQMLLIVAPYGSGKSIFARQLINNTDSLYQIRTIDADAKLTRHTLLDKITGSMVTTANEFADINEQFYNYIEICSKDEKIPVLFIDDADHLPDDLLVFITELTRYKYNQTNLRVALFCDNSITARLKEVKLNSQFKELFHYIDIPPLTLEQTERYLKYLQLEGIGLQEQVVPDHEIKNIYKASAGRPGRIKDLFIMTLQDPALTNRGNKSSSLSGISFVKQRDLIITSALLVTILLIYPKIHQANKTTDLALTLPAQSQERIKTASAGKRLNLTDLRSNAWLNQQQPGLYVLQLIGANEKKTILTFIESAKIPPAQLAWFRTKISSKYWYVLVYGLYPDKESARVDIELLPPIIKSNGPWPRSIANIQTALRAH